MSNKAKIREEAPKLNPIKKRYKQTEEANNS